MDKRMRVERIKQQNKFSEYTTRKLQKYKSALRKVADRHVSLSAKSDS